MKNSGPNIDGFVRRSNDSHRPRLGIDSMPVPERFLSKPKPLLNQSNHIGQISGGVNARPAVGINSRRERMEDAADKTQVNQKKAAVSRSDIDDALKGISSEAHQKQHRKFKFKKLFKRFSIAVIAIALIIGAYVGIKAFLAGGRVFSGNLFSALLNEGKPLKTDQYGRVNVLLFGTSEDDPGHDGGDLSDSIMIASIHPENKEGFMVSVPRDLWVKYGQACSSGYEGKINVAYQCGKDGRDEKSGAEFLKNIVGSNFGIDINYYAQVNYTALRQAVEAVGGITVEIDSDDPRGILDRNFDWKCNYNCYYVKWPNGPANLNGEQALALARARNATGGYGLGGGNFDREQYQQKIIVALRSKAMSAGVLANPVAVTGLLDSLGDNVRTNFDAGEIKTLIKLAKEVEGDKIRSINLVNEDKPLVTTGSYSGQSIVRPVAGVYDFSQIQNYIKANLSGDTAALEEAVIDVLNGSGVPGAAQKLADKLAEQGYTIGLVDNAPSTQTGYVIYDLSDGRKPATKKKLEQTYGVTAQSQIPPGIASDSDFVIIVGTNGAD